jgi:hypothetical protein
VVVPGARVGECAQELVGEVKDRLGGRPPALLTSDQHAADETAIVETFSEAEPPAAGPRRPGRPRLVPPRRPAAGLVDATVCKERKQGRVVSIRRTVVLGGESAVEEVLRDAVCSRTINTSFLERRHATDRGQNARKSRRTYRFSKGWRGHEAMTDFTAYRDNFCGPVRTLRIKAEDGRWQRRTPAIAAGLADHVWSLVEWISFPAIQYR